MRTERKVLTVVSALLGFVCAAANASGAEKHWHIGTPITTYYAGPSINDATAKEMAAGGFNLVWCTEQELDTVGKFGLRAQLTAPELSPQTMNDPAQIARLDALIERVKRHPALYTYYVIDEPGASLFPALGKLVARIREHDPAHAAYINLFPTYANNDQLGTKGDTITAYREHLRLFIEQVRPDILSYDHYHFTAAGRDGDQYFLNLGMIRRAALDAGIPFMNIVQGCSWDPAMRVPNGDEMRWLNYTSLAYGAQALSYYVYGPNAGHVGGMRNPDGSTTPGYAAAGELNPQFIALASQLQPLRSLGAYHAGMVPWGAVPLPEKTPFHLEFSGEGMAKMPAEGMLLGYFGTADRNGTPGRPTHVLVVNLNYRGAVTTVVVGPDRLGLFDPGKKTWTGETGSHATITLPPGGGKLLRIQR